jgi:hypothetical protein
VPATTKAPKENPPKPKLEVSIAYNGMNSSFSYTSNMPVQAIRAQALSHYGVKGQDRQENFLFGPDNQTEIPDGQEMGNAVTPGSQLYLRRRAAGGGRS